MSDAQIIFEHPMSERLRSFLRLEALFTQFDANVAADETERHHAALGNMFEIMECASRSDLKLEILQELERQRQRALLSAEAGDHAPWLPALQSAAQNLQTIQQRFGQHLRENEWLMALKQRMATPGATTAAESPSYYFWQRQPAPERRAHLTQWSGGLMPTRDAIEVLLQILRAHSVRHACQADNGSYEQAGPNTQVQLLRIEVAADAGVVPEVSANKYQTHIRFMGADFQHVRGKVTATPIAFHLSQCSFESFRQPE